MYTQEISTNSGLSGYFLHSFNSALPPLPKGRWILQSKRRRDTFTDLLFSKISPSHDFVVPAPFRQGGLKNSLLKNSTNPNLPTYLQKAFPAKCCTGSLCGAAIYFISCPYKGTFFVYKNFYFVLYLINFFVRLSVVKKRVCCYKIFFKIYEK